MTNNLTKPPFNNRYANIPTQDGLDTCFIAYNKGVQDALKMVENLSGVMEFINMHHEECWQALNQLAGGS